MTGALRRAASELIELEGVFAALAADLREVRLRGPRARQATITALTVGIAATVGLLAHMDMPWWAAISGFMSVQATRPGSFQRAGLRILGTAAGAWIAFAMTPFIVHDHVATSLFLFVSGFIGSLGYMVSRRAYAWLFFALTANLVVLMSINDPTATFRYAFYRTVEVAIGSFSALFVALLLAPDGAAAAADPAPGWSDLFGARWPAVLHAVRTGVTVMLMPWAWSYLHLPSLTQMAVTVAAVMAVPVLTDHPLDQGRKIAGRAAQRIIGCFLGGLWALATLALSINQFVPWLAMLTASIWLGANMQAGERDVSYVSTQASVVFIMMLVQGGGPPDSILPGLDRFAGILGGLAILLVVSLLLWPAEWETEQRQIG